MLNLSNGEKIHDVKTFTHTRTLRRVNSQNLERNVKTLNQRRTLRCVKSQNSEPSIKRKFCGK
ncbi:hypothetical protein HanPI659440_Chr08g0302971 [Helianthus annuus]|nr:hypothetical protein HanPI659440_Chr08g0302971 [Helianthus annuus]